MSSTIPTVKANLLTRFKADSDLSGIQISWGNPYKTRMQEELIIIGNARLSELPAGLGSDSREENYTVDVVVSIARTARETQQTMETRAFAIAAVIEDSIIDWRTEASVFSGLNGWIEVQGMSSGEAVSEDGKTREASVTITLSVVARK